MLCRCPLAPSTAAAELGRVQGDSWQAHLRRALLLYARAFLSDPLHSSMQINLAHIQKLRPEIHQGLREILNKTQKNHPPYISEILHQAALACGHLIPPNYDMEMFVKRREGEREDLG